MSEQKETTTHKTHGLPGARQINCKINGKKGIIYLTPDHIQIFTQKTSLGWTWIIIGLALIAGTIYGYLKIPTLDWLWLLTDIIAILLIIWGFNKHITQETIVFYEDAVLKRKHNPPFHKTPAKQVFDQKRTVSINYANNKATLKISYGTNKYTFNITNIREPQAKLFEKY